MIDFLWNVRQQAQIAKSDVKAERADDRARELETRLAHLERRIEAASLASQAMWELLRERTQTTDAELLARMQEIDLRDGQADGKITPQPITCTACQRLANTRRKNCLYCGEPLPVTTLFSPG